MRIVFGTLFSFSIAFAGVESYDYGPLGYEGLEKFATGREKANPVQLTNLSKTDKVTYKAQLFSNGTGYKTTIENLGIRISVGVIGFNDASVAALMKKTNSERDVDSTATEVITFVKPFSVIYHIDSGRTVGSFVVEIPASRIHEAVANLEKRMYRQYNIRRYTVDIRLSDPQGNYATSPLLYGKGNSLSFLSSGLSCSGSGHGEEFTRFLEATAVNSPDFQFSDFIQRMPDDTRVKDCTELKRF